MTAAGGTASPRPPGEGAAVTGIAVGHALPSRRAFRKLQQDHSELDIGVSTDHSQPAYYASGTHGDGTRLTLQSGTVEGLRSQIEGPLVDFEDASLPSIPRVYDYWLGGRTNFASDRELAARIEELWPHTRAMVRENRGFLKLAVRWVASQGVGQFIDAGSGLPAIPAVHQIAREVIPAARVAYADNEMLVIRHWESEYTASDPGLAAVAANLRYPAAVLADPALAGVIDMGRPVCVILALVLQFQEASAARKIAAGFIRALAPGSFVIITVPVGETRLGARITEAYTAGTIHGHSPETVRSFFHGTHIQAPGLLDAREWKPRGPAVPAPPRDAIVLAGVGRKPGTRQ